MTKENIEIHEWICPKCKKLIRALNENQFNYYKKQHEEMHKRKNDNNK